jgi:protease-4
LKFINHKKEKKIMKDFLKYTLATVVGIFLAGIVFTILGIISLVGMVATSDTETKVKENSIFELRLDGTIEERSQAEDPFSKLLGATSTTTYGLDDILSSIKKAKSNDNIKGIYIEGGVTGGSSFASCEAIRRALVDFKESGKFIVAYSDNYGQDTYYLASVADKIFINPQGSLAWHGLSSQPIFYKELLEKIGVKMQVFKVGTYKSAVEPYIATSMSDANREQVTVFLEDLWGKMLNDISVSRNITVDSLSTYADRFMDLQPAQTYLDYGLVDSIVYKSDVREYLKQLTNRKDDENIRSYLVSDMVNVKRNVPKDKSGNIIAVYYAAGDIDGGGVISVGPAGIQSPKVVKDLRKLREDKTVKAVVLRVNSPGGSAFGSEQIWNEVVALKAEKPVIVSMGDYAASGGYYISCAADTIVAEETTLTGSIGIFGVFPDASELMNKKLGINFDVVKTNKMSDFGTMSRPFNADEQQILQQYINNGYSLFVKRCADGRGMTTEAIEAIAEGRVWTGIRAKELGLVDEIGGLDKAIELAAHSADIEGYSVVSYPKKEGMLSSFLEGEKDKMVKSKLQEYIGEYFNGLQYIKGLKEMDPIQARIPFDLNIH